MSEPRSPILAVTESNRLSILCCAGVRATLRRSNSQNGLTARLQFPAVGKRTVNAEGPASRSNKPLMRNCERPYNVDGPARRVTAGNIYPTGGAITSCAHDNPDLAAAGGVFYFRQPASTPSLLRRPADAPAVWRGTI